MIESINDAAEQFAALAWGPWLLVLLLGGGAYFLARSRFVPFRYLPHAFALLRGKYDDPNDPGEITHFQALSAALAGTIGMGNIGGVALAINMGGPGAIFWMWLTAILGIATKFFTCSLTVMYRGRDAAGQLQGGPMYVIREALPRPFWGLAYLFAVVGLIGCLPVFQTNQLVQVIREVIVFPNAGSMESQGHMAFDLGAGALIAVVVGAVVFGGLPRIAAVTSRVVPFMAALYLASALLVLILHFERVPEIFALIVREAFADGALFGGALGAVILIGVQRGAFSNEAGIGTEALAHGAAKTREPIREGLVAMTGPIIDTLLICSATAFVILVSGTWQSSDANGVTLTANAFRHLLGSAGLWIIVVCIVCFATTTMFTYAYYGTKCFGFLVHPRYANIYRSVYVGLILVAAVISIEAAVGIIDGAYALMAIPTMVSSLILAPKVLKAAKWYFRQLREAA